VVLSFVEVAGNRRRIYAAFSVRARKRRAETTGDSITRNLGGFLDENASRETNVRVKMRNRGGDAMHEMEEHAELFSGAVHLAVQLCAEVTFCSHATRSDQIEKGRASVEEKSTIDSARVRHPNGGSCKCFCESSSQSTGITRGSRAGLDRNGATRMRG